jgi:hypothetical protein
MTKEMEYYGGRVLFHCTAYSMWLWNNILSTTTHLEPPPAICKVGMYIPSAHPWYGELLVLAGIREYSHSIKEAAGNPTKKKNPLEQQTTRWKC